jgi:hypothetical protein
MMEMLMTRDITENGKYELSNVSSDKRCLRDTKTFYLNEIDFDAPYLLNVYTINDSIQLKI